MRSISLPSDKSLQKTNSYPKLVVHSATDPFQKVCDESPAVLRKNAV